MSKEKYGVHIAHCCYIHGCKYGDKDCPVASGEVAQKYPCYYCGEEDAPYTIEEIELLSKTKSYRPTYEQLKNRVADLEAKLAEKEKAIENYEKFTSVPLVEMTKMYEQDKIDYAVEQLERVKDALWTEIDSFYDDYGDRCVETADVEFFIDNQIKQLKEGK